MYVLSPTFFKNSNTVDNRLQHDFQSYAWELHTPTLIFFHGLLITDSEQSCSMRQRVSTNRDKRCKEM